MSKSLWYARHKNSSSHNNKKPKHSSNSKLAGGGGLIRVGLGFSLVSVSYFARGCGSGSFFTGRLLGSPRYKRLAARTNSSLAVKKHFVGSSANTRPTASKS